MKRITRTLFCLPLLLVGIVSLAGAAEYHVDASSGFDTSSGLSWSDALATIGQALSLAAVTPEDDIVRVAEGTYAENLAVPSGVVLEGGYPSGGGTRDPGARRTIVDGGRIDSVISVGPDATGVVIDGFSITGGSGLLGGGGIFADRSEVTIRNNLVYDNEVPTAQARGGGIALRGPTPGTTGSVVEDNRITDNIVLDGNGGGIAVMEFEDPAGPPARISRNLIRGNVASGGADFLGRGGGIYILNNDATVEDNQLVENIAEGGAQQTGNGGGLLVLEADALVSRNLVRDNLARGLGGSFSGSGGGVYVNTFSGEIRDNRIEGNRADGGSGGASAFGGGLFAFLGSPTVTSNVIRGNSLDATGCSSARGGGVYLSETPSSFTDNEVIGNTNFREEPQGGGNNGCWSNDQCRCFIGGGIWSYQLEDGLLLESNRIESNEASDGGGITLNGSVVTELRHNQIRGNEAIDFLGAGMEVFFGDPVLFNNEIVRNTGDGLVLIGSQADPATASLQNVTLADNGRSCPGPNPFCGIGLYTFYADGLDVRNSIIIGNGLSDWVDQPDGNNDPTTNVYTFAYTDFGDNLLSGPGNIAINPLFVRGPFGSHYLSATATGQGADSPCIDASTDLAADTGLDTRATTIDDAPDQGALDLGFHYPRFAPDGKLNLWQVAREGDRVTLRFTREQGADAYRIYRGDLDRLPDAYTHQSPFTTGSTECNVAGSFLQLPGAADEPGNFYYLIVPLTGGVEGDFGATDVERGGADDGQRTRPEEDAADEVVNACP